MHNDIPHIFAISHDVICTYLEYYRKTGYKFAGKLKSWDMIKWNAYQNLFLSKKALNEFLIDDQLILIKSKKKFNGVLKRCFMKEHMFPSKCLSDFFFTIFKDKNPSIDQTKLILTTLNATCYVWQAENIALSDSGLNSEIQSDGKEIDYRLFFDPSADSESNFKNLTILRKIRYGNLESNIEALETRFHNKSELSKNLNLLRQGKLSRKDVFR
tara:strand:+ start:449 stop:1090 length:642 start_codon:yes stop_codon:yes gene_type:complete